MVNAKEAKQITNQTELGRLHEEWMISVKTGDLETSDLLWQKMLVLNKDDEEMNKTSFTHSDPNSPPEIAEQLIEVNGSDLAIEVVRDRIQYALQDGDNYALSIWREVRVILQGKV